MHATRVVPTLAAVLLAAPLAALPVTVAGAAEPSPFGKLAVRDALRSLHEGRIAGGTDGAAAAAEAPTSPQSTSRLSAAGSAAALDCAAYSSDNVTFLADRTVFHIAPAGAGSVTIDRVHTGGAKTRVATALPGNRAEFADLRSGRGVPASYTVTFTFSDGSSQSCDAVDAAQAPEDLVLASDLDGQIGAAGFYTSPSTLASRDSYTPAFSPDGRWLAYSTFSADGDLDVFVRRADGTGRGVPLPSTAGYDVEAAFSFDGRYASYTSYNDDTFQSDLMVVDLSTGTLRKVPNTADLAQSVWTTDGRLLVTDFSSDFGPLLFVHPSTGARTALAGSAGGWMPDTAANGTISYATFNEETGIEELRVVAAGVTSTIETLAEGRMVMAARMSAAPADRVVYVEGAVVLDPDTGDLQEVSAELRVDSIAGGASSVAIEGSRPMETPTALDVRAPLSTGTSDFTGDRTNDVLARDRDGVLWVYPGQHVVNASNTLGTRVRVGAGWNTMNAIVAAGDMTSDGRADVLARDTSGVLWLYPGTGKMSPVLGTRARVSGGWGSYAIVAGGDYNGDLSADILARDSAGSLWLYPGTGTGGRGAAALAARTLVGRGWNVMNALVAVGDATYDGVPDLFARDRNTGVAYLYPGTGTGLFGARTSLGAGWPHTAYVGIENHALEGEAVGLLMREPDGSLVVQRFGGDRKLSAGSWVISKGWNPYTITG